MPVLAPVTWNSDGWPVLQTVNGTWGGSYPYPNVPRPPRPVKPMTGTDTFAGTTLGPQWEWNHNPDNTKWSVNNGLRLQTATVTNDLYNARNTLTHRIQGPTSTATIELDYSTMRDGDRAGLAMLRDPRPGSASSATTARPGSSMVNGLTMDGNWNTTSTGTEVAARRRLRRQDLAAGQRGHPPRLRPAGPLLLQHRRHHLHLARPGLHPEQRLAVLHGLPLRHLQLRHPVPSAAR